MRLRYHSGEHVEVGDNVKYGHWSAKVDFIVTEHTGDKVMDWYLEQCPNGGFMITSEFGQSFFIDHSEDDQDLELVGRNSR